MTKKELERVEVIALRRSGRISQKEAGRRLGVTERQVRRMEARFVSQGAAGLRSAQRGRPSNRRVPEAIWSKVSVAIRAHYRGFGPTLASEYLAEHHGVHLSKETVRKIMIKARLWRPQRGPKARLHRLRERRPRFGELIQVDGSFHDWFEGRAASCCLLVFIDDATSRITQLRFAARECTFAYMHTLYGHICEHGMPMALYSDRHSIFRVVTGDKRADVVSEFGRALAVLGVESICANSPQAKGRVERANGTLQDRLIKAMRVARINSIDQANAWLPSFVERHNARFAIEASDPNDAHVHYSGPDLQLRRVLSKHHPRTLSKDLTCQFHSTLVQVDLESSASSYRGAAVIILEHFDGSHELLYRNASLPFTFATKTRRAPIEIGRTELTRMRRSTAHPPKPNHPWKTTPILKSKPGFVASP